MYFVRFFRLARDRSQKTERANYCELPYHESKCLCSFLSFYVAPGPFKNGLICSMNECKSGRNILANEILFHEFTSCCCLILPKTINFLLLRKFESSRWHCFDHCPKIGWDIKLAFRTYSSWVPLKNSQQTSLVQTTLNDPRVKLKFKSNSMGGPFYGVLLCYRNLPKEILICWKNLSD